MFIKAQPSYTFEHEAVIPGDLVTFTCASHYMIENIEVLPTLIVYFADAPEEISCGEDKLAINPVGEASIISKASITPVGESEVRQTCGYVWPY